MPFTVERRGWVLLLVLLATGVIGVLMFVIFREGPDRTVVGRVVDVEPHQVCVDAGSARRCAEVDSPSDVSSVARGDCVRLQTSPQRQLVSVRDAAGCD
jgi:acyl-coenzyme A synthetase/AMP-(fatty) acid ligase